MDPVSGLALACNIIDLVGKAVKGGAAVLQVYKSVNGLSNANETITRAADSLRDIVTDLQECHSQAPENTANQKMRQISATLISQCVELQSVLDWCRSSKKWGVFSASKASAKSLRMSGKIQQLQDDIVASRDELFRWIAASTRTDVEATLRQLKAISKTNCEISTTLYQVNARLDVAFQSSTEEDPTMNGATSCLEEIRQVVADRVILQLLDFPNLGTRFEEVVTEGEGTLEWIFTEPAAAFTKEPRLATTFPDWLKYGDGIFHICGKPGSGKSTLMKFLCRHPTTKELLTKWAGDGDQLLFAKFFFWRVGVVQEQRNMKGLIRGLLYQVLCKIPTLSRVIFSQATRDMLVKGLQRHAGAELDSDEIIAAFSRLVGVSGKSSALGGQGLGGIRICLFVDGLDEFDNTKIHQTHRELVQKLCQWTANSGGRVKICVSSRTQEPFMQMLDESKRFTLHWLTEGDIELFVERQLENHPKFQMHQQKSPKECQELIHKIRQAADGVFLYVALVLKDLRDGLDDGIPIHRLQKVVSETPEDLNTLLERIMGGINKSFRDGPEVLLTTLLRATGTLLSPEDRDPEYVLFDEAPFSGVVDFNLSALGSFFVLRAIDRRVSMQEDVNMQDFDIEKEEWFCDGMSDDEITKAVCTAVRARCNGLIDIVNDKHVKFMHRSVPEFLHGYFSRCSPSSLRVDDHRATVIMAWTYLVDMKWDEAKHAQGLSLLSFLRGKSAPHLSVLDQVDGDLKSEGKKIGSEEKMRSTALICRLRQMKLGSGWEDLFHILLFIDQAVDRRWASSISSYQRLLATPEYARNQHWSLIDSCAFFGLHEFIDWLFQKTTILADDIRRFRVMRSATTVFYQDQCSHFSLRVMETVFACHGLDGRMAFPRGTETLAGRPLWHAVLLELVPFEETETIPDSQRHWSAAVGFHSEWQDLVADVMELWLRHGADPQACFRLSEDGNICEGVSSALDNSGYISSSEARIGVSNRVASGMRSKGKKELSLHEVVLYWKPHNESSLLHLLLTDDAPVGNLNPPTEKEPPKVDPDSSGTGQDHLAPCEELTLSPEDLGIKTAIKDTSNGAWLITQWSHEWAMHNLTRLFIHFAFISVLGFIVAYLV